MIIPMLLKIDFKAMGDLLKTEGYHSKSWNNLPTTPDIVITVCGNTAAEICPAYLGKVMRAHWGVDDPAKATGTEVEIDAAFEKAYSILRRRIETFLAIDFKNISDHSEIAK